MLAGSSAAFAQTVPISRVQEGLERQKADLVGLRAEYRVDRHDLPKGEEPGIYAVGRPVGSSLAVKEHRGTLLFEVSEAPARRLFGRAFRWRGWFVWEGSTGSPTVSRLEPKALDLTPSSNLLSGTLGVDGLFYADALRGRRFQAESSRDGSVLVTIPGRNPSGPHESRLRLLPSKGWALSSAEVTQAGSGGMTYRSTVVVASHRKVGSAWLPASFRHVTRVNLNGKWSLGEDFAASLKNLQPRFLEADPWSKMIPGRRLTRNSDDVEGVILPDGSIRWSP
ncbi:MAG: hypothetical protein MH204_07170 [Fimbriimonadaceae bacterium]|nr:hypothetical protein [Fimbriimonadaceae bacterium]